jgi:hypothetical protein
MLHLHVHPVAFALRALRKLQLVGKVATFNTCTLKQGKAQS